MNTGRPLLVPDALQDEDWKSNPDIKLGMIAISSPVARAMIGKHEGDTITIDAPAGQREYEIVGVRYEG